jgi:AcrR family transcriptional regulator
MAVYNHRMSRQRSIPDSEVLTAAGRVILRIGPTGFRLADITKETGLAPATLLQRFGSKRGLLLALTRVNEKGTDECFAQIRAKHSSPLAGLAAVVEALTSYAETPEAMANSLAFLQIHLTDRDFHRSAVLSARAITTGIQALLDEAVAARELVRCDTESLARLIDGVRYGSMLTWAIHREGSITDWLRRDVQALLRPLRASPRRGKKRKTRN